MIKILQAATSMGSFNNGSEKAPKAILENSLRSALEYNGLSYAEVPEITDKLKPSKEGKLRNYHAMVDFNKRLNKASIDSVEESDIMLTLGGDHSIGIGSMFASKAIWPETKVVYIDAHPDCSSPATTPSGNIHGMPLSTVLGDALYVDFDLPKYSYDEVFIIGAKDIDDSEISYLKNNKISFYTIDEIIRRGIADVMDEVKQKLNSKPVHVSLDVDSIDLAFAPATEIINSGGLTRREASYICRHLEDQNIKAIDLVEINPDKDIDNQTINLGTELVLDLLGGKWTEYVRYLMQHKTD